ncbi:MAG: MBL fold metallo-hydrolase [Bacillota bacterium]
MKVHRRVVGPLGTNCYILQNEETGKGVVIDPGDEGARILEVIQKLGLTLEGIILTHGHLDHILDAGLIQVTTGAVVLIGEGDKAFLEDPGWMKAFIDTSGMVSVKDYRIVKEGDVITVGNSRLYVIETPGHSPGSISLYCPGRPASQSSRTVSHSSPGILFSGDLIFRRSVGRTDFPGGDMDLLLANVRNKILTLPDDTLIYPGHNAPTTVGEERTENPFLL